MLAGFSTFVRLYSHLRAVFVHISSILQKATFTSHSRYRCGLFADFQLERLFDFFKCRRLATTIARHTLFSTFAHALPASVGIFLLRCAFRHYVFFFSQKCHENLLYAALFSPLECRALLPLLILDQPHDVPAIFIFSKRSLRHFSFFGAIDILTFQKIVHARAIRLILPSRLDTRHCFY